MGLENESAIADRFAAYVGELTKVIGHTDRAGPRRDYCSRLLATEGRHSVEPMAAVTAPARVSAQHQRLLHFVANATWSDELTVSIPRQSRGLYSWSRPRRQKGSLTRPLKVEPPKGGWVNARD